jgi:hypothetical protein
VHAADVMVGPLVWRVLEETTSEGAVELRRTGLGTMIQVGGCRTTMKHSDADIRPICDSNHSFAGCRDLA